MKIRKFVSATGTIIYNPQGTTLFYNQYGSIQPFAVPNLSLYTEVSALRSDSRLYKKIEKDYASPKATSTSVPTPTINLGATEPQLPDEPLPEVPKEISIEKVSGIELLLIPETNKFMLRVGTSTVEATPESFATMKSNFLTTKKLVVDFASSIGTTPRYKLGDRVLLWGPTGTGKTFSFHNVSHELTSTGQVDYVEKITITEGFEDIDFLAYIVPQENGGIKYQERGVISMLREASKGKKVALCIDELNRGSRSFMNFVLTFLDGVDGDNYVLNNFLKDEKLIIPMENVLLFATMNLGGKYTGTSVMDEALLDRFTHVDYVSYNTTNEQKMIDDGFGGFSEKAKAIVYYVREIHNSGEIRSSISTRGVKMWANNFINTLCTDRDFYDSFARTLLYRLINVDDYGNPNKEELILIMGKFKELGIAIE